MTTEQINIDELWDYQRPAESEARFRQVLSSLSSEPAASAELMTQIARAQGLQRHFAEAHATLDEVEARIGTLPLRSRVRYLLERGRVFNSAGSPQEAAPLFEEAFRLAEPVPEEAFYAVDAAHMLAIVSPPDGALAWNLRALALADSSGDPRTRNWRGSLLNNIGWTFHAAGDYTAAFDYLSRALDFHRERGNSRATRIARWSVARVRRDLGQVREALAEQMALLSENDALGEGDGYVPEEIGECLAALGDAAGAQPYFARAYTELSADPWLVANEPERLARLKRLGTGESPPALAG